MTSCFSTSDEGPNQAVLDAAYALAASRQMCCREDLTLLVSVVRELPRRPWVVQLGAGSGTMGLAVMGARDDVSLWSIDFDQQALNWELEAFTNAQVELHMPGGHEIVRYYPKWGDSETLGRDWWGNTEIDLLIVDADHSYDGVIEDLGAWRAHSELIFVHDYDGTTAPEQYPSVRVACDEMWGETPPLYKAGWSAVFRSPWNIHRSSH